VLYAAAIAAHLLRSVLDALRNRLRIRFIALRERVLIPGGAVADSLLSTIAICWAELAPDRADSFLPHFILTRCSARLACVHE
jgi:hypothetical protein